MIYQWFNPLYLKYAEYGGKTEEDEAAISWDSPILGTPLPPLSQWKTPTLVQYIGDRRIRKPRIIADAVSTGGIHLISQKAADALHDIWDKHATLYPVLLEDKPEEPYYMVVMHTVIDCLDREQSIGSKALEETERGQKGYFDSLGEWVMREEEIGDNELFVLPDSNTAIYTTEAFKQQVLQADLTGFCFVRYFDDDKPFIS